MPNILNFIVPGPAKTALAGAALAAPRVSAGLLLDFRQAAGPGPEAAAGLQLLLDAAGFLALPPGQAAQAATIFVEFHPALDAPGPEAFRAALGARDPRLKLVLATSDLDFAASLLSGPGAPCAIALKCSEAAGAASTETAGVLLDHALRLLGPDAPPLGLWGGIASPEAAAAFLATGASFLVMEHVHWLTGGLGLGQELQERLRGLKPDASSVLDAGPGVQWRFFDKGNSQAVRSLRKLATLAEPGQVPLQAAQMVRAEAKSLEASSLSSGELIPLGPEAAFAGAFAQRFGADTGQALSGFAEETLSLWDEAPRIFQNFLQGQACRELGTRLPFVQGAMSWISDSLDFARAVADAGALPTLAVGMRTPELMDRDFARAREVLGDRPYAMNVLVLDENPQRDGQLAWLLEHRPPFVAVAAGSPVFAGELRQKGLEVIYLAADIGLLRMAAEVGIRFIVLEGCEAGGHVGRLSQLTLAQAALTLRRAEPELLRGVHVVLAGGICDGRGVLRAAMLGASAVQMGTVYLSSREIVDTGALSALYRQRILEAGLACTRISGESVGLRVRALDTAKVRQIRQLEREKALGGLDETAFRHELEALSTGSLLVAARGVQKPGGPALSEDACAAQGQFMSGAVAANVSSIRSLEQIHAGLTRAKAVAAPRTTAPKAVAPASSPGVQERIAVTGMAMANSLGQDTTAIIEASLSGASGIGTVPGERWDHSRYQRAGQVASGVTYTGVGAFMNLACTRKDLGVSPQDFRTMSASTRLTLLLARRAIEESGLAGRVAGARVAVLTSQNSAEAASTVSSMLFHVFADELGEVAWRAASLTPEQRSAVTGAIRAQGLDVDDTTLIGRLNCTASGHVCNQFGFGGPSYSVGAACASSLIALYNAVLLIRAGVIDAAVVGGGEELLTPIHYCEFSALRALAGVTANTWTPGQHSRPFDRHRGGFVLGEGGAVLVIEREAVARERGAPIQAFITGVGACTNHQGIVESVAESQLIALRAAQADAGYGLDEVDLVECHGTSTVQGDREEVRALKALRADQKTAGGQTVLASFKSQIGHTLGASGISSMIRGIGALRRGLLPPTLNYTTPDPDIALEDAGFRILSRAEPWPVPAHRPRRMQVNAFGFGGACVVVHLEGADAPDLPCALPEPAGDGASAGTSGATASYHTASIKGREYRVGLTGPQGPALELLRKHAASDLDSAALAKLARKGVFLAPADETPQPLALLCSGQGLFYQGMGRALAKAHPAFAQEIERLAACADYDLKRLLFEADETQLRDTRWQQPALFAFECALARQLLALGVQPAAVAGHSLGEFTALCLAGVLTPEDAFGMVDLRARLMAQAAQSAAAPTAMAAVALPVEALEWKLAKFPGLCITNFNGPKQAVVGGDAAAVAELVRTLKAQQHRATLLKVSMAFHSPAMRDVRDEFKAFLDSVPFASPVLPIVSNVAKGPFPADPAEIRRIMVAHLETPVHWLQNVYYLTSELGIRRFVELGPGDVLSGLVQDICEDAVTVQTAAREGEADVFAAALARLYSWGSLTPPADPTALDLAEDAAPQARPAGTAAPVSPQVGAHGDVLEGVIRIIMEATGYERGEIEPDMDLRQDLAIRSTRLPVIMDQAEKAFGLTFRVEDFIGVATVRQMAERISELGGELGDPAGAAAAPAPHPSAGQAPAKASTQAQGTDHLEGVIRIIMEATGYERDEIEPDMDLRQDLAIRSTRLPVIMDQAEKAFGLTFRVEDFIGVATVRQMAERIAALSGEPGGKADAAAPVAQTAAEQQPAQEADAPDFIPVARFQLRETPLELAPCALPADLSGKAVVLASTSAPGAWGREMAQAVAQGLSARPVPLDLSQPLPREDKPAGLVLLLEPGETAQDTDRLLALAFARLKEFITSANKRFCVLITPETPHGEPRRVFFEGVLGMLLTLAQEYQSVRCLGLRLANGVAPGAALLDALALAGPVERLLRSDAPGAALTPRMLPVALPEVSPDAPALRPGDVLVASGGASGVTLELLATLAPLGPRLVLLGRRPEGEAERQALARLKDLGAEAEYRSCDVSDRAAVAGVLADIARNHGRIDGIVHGAGLLRDKFLAMMSPEDFASVLAVKLGGLRNLLEAAEGAGLRFVAAFSSVAAWQGNVGQTNYCCANRAMASLLSGLAGRGLTVKTLWLPPVGGVGMASGAEIRALMERKGLGQAYVEIDELAVLFGRELAALDAEPSVLFARRLPQAGTAAPLGAPQNEAEAGRLLPVGTAPMLDTARLASLAPLTAVCARLVNHEKDPWLPEHKPYKFLPQPLFSAVMVVESFGEAARALLPHLRPVGLENLRFLDMLPCAPGQTRSLRIFVERTGQAGSLTLVDARLESEDISPKGRPLGRWSANFEGRVLLGREPGVLPPPPGADALPPFDGRALSRDEVLRIYEDHTGQTGRYRMIETIPGTTVGRITGTMRYQVSRDVPGASGAFCSSPYLLEGLMQLVFLHRQERGDGKRLHPLPVGIERLDYARPCADGEELTLMAVLREDRLELQIWDAWGVNARGEILLRLQGLTMRFLDRD